MHSPLFLFAKAAIMSLAVASTTHAISLSNFTPRIENLPSSCMAAYTATIDGCQGSDFAENARCSVQCVEGLLKIAETVTQQCANVDVPETSIIGVFRLGAGVPAVCPDVQVTTIGKSSTQAPPSQTSTQAQASSTLESSPAESSTAASSSADATGGASSASSTSTAETTIATDAPEPSSTTGTTPQIEFDTSAAALPPAPTTTSVPQQSNQNSGGGSPFDVQAGSASSPLRLGGFVTTAMLGLAVFITAFL